MLSSFRTKSQQIRKKTDISRWMYYGMDELWIISGKCDGINVTPVHTIVCSTHPLIRVLLNSNFCYFERIFKSLELALRNSYVLCCLIRTPIIQTFC